MSIPNLVIFLLNKAVAEFCVCENTST